MKEKTKGRIHLNHSFYAPIIPLIPNSMLILLKRSNKSNLMSVLYFTIFFHFCQFWNMLRYTEKKLMTVTLNLFIMFSKKKKNVATPFAFVLAIYYIIYGAFPVSTVLIALLFLEYLYICLLVLILSHTCSRLNFFFPFCYDVDTFEIKNRKQ